MGWRICGPVWLAERERVVSKLVAALAENTTCIWCTLATNNISASEWGSLVGVGDRDF
jgi:hypothetical protein